MHMRCTRAVVRRECILYSHYLICSGRVQAVCEAWARASARSVCVSGRHLLLIFIHSRECRTPVGMRRGRARSPVDCGYSCCGRALVGAGGVWHMNVG